MSYLIFFCQVRIFRWNKSLRHIVNALTASIFPVVNSLVIFFLFTCIYSVLATRLFGQSNGDIGYEYFGLFSSSVFTMIQVNEKSPFSSSHAFQAPLPHACQAPLPSPPARVFF